MTLFTLPTLAVLIGLGIWQLERREWKQELIARLEARLSAEPAPLPRPGDDPAAVEFRRVHLTGELLQDRQQYLVGRSYQGASGYEVLTPLALPDGRHVFVDRGWIPLAAKDAPLPRSETPQRATDIDGIIRLPPPEGAAASRGNEHYRLDLRRMAEQAGLDPQSVVPVYVVATGRPESGRLPVPRTVAVEVPNNHLQYALTWFSLAGVLAVIFVIASRRH